MKKESSKASVSQKTGISSDDPRQIAPNIAAISPPLVQSLKETRGEKLDLAKICKRAKRVANLTTKFALSLHACVIEVCNHPICKQFAKRFAHVQICN